tara:strand:- start:1491 stop:2129 length:639 start_codon:yes stop_codon:yes gene_type:complete
VIKFLLNPNVYWRAIGLLFTFTLIILLNASINNSRVIKGFAAIQMGQYKLSYHLMFDREHTWSPATKSGYAQMLLRGEYIAQDIPQAKKLLYQAAKDCDTTALNEIGLSYFKGDLGNEKDFVKAFDYILLASMHGHQDAMAHVAWMFANGIGTERDLPQALYWTAIAGLKGNAYAWGQLNSFKQLFEPEDFRHIVNNISTWKPLMQCQPIID